MFSIPPDHVTLVDLICKIDDSFKRTVDKSHLLSTLHPEKSGPSLVSSKDEDTSASEVKMNLESDQMILKRKFVQSRNQKYCNYWKRMTCILLTHLKKMKMRSLRKVLTV